MRRALASWGRRLCSQPAEGLLPRAASQNDNFYSIQISRFLSTLIFQLAENKALPFFYSIQMIGHKLSVRCILSSRTIDGDRNKNARKNLGLLSRRQMPHRGRALRRARSV